jgi:hypothetical protein
MARRDFKIRVANQPLALSWVWASVVAGFVPGSTGPEIAADGTFVLAGKVYGPKMGPRGPMQVIVAPFNQGDVGYCFETNNVAENLPAKWASRGCNAIKVGHPDSVLRGRAAQFLTASENAGLMLIAAPTWPEYFQSDPDPASLDFRDLAINDPYWRVNWISYQTLDEIDLLLFPLSDHVNEVGNWVLGGLTKPNTANFTRRAAIPAAQEGGAAILFRAAFDSPVFNGLSIDSYEWHLTTNTNNYELSSGARSSPEMFISGFNHLAPYNPADTNTRGAVGRRLSASPTGMAVRIQRGDLPLIPGRSDSGNMPVQYPPIFFNDPPYTVLGGIILPQPAAYAPGDKFNGHYIATGRVEIFSSTYPQTAKWQPGRFLRSETWSGFVAGSCALYLFPQTVGTATATGYVDAAANTLVITSEPVRPFLFGGAVRVIADGGTEVGWVTRDNPQVSGTPGGAGTYTLDPAKRTPVNTGTAMSPVTLSFGTEARPWGDDSNPENLAELAAVIDNLERMQAHPTGGNLMIDTSVGGRRAFTVMNCPDSLVDLSNYKEDLTLAPVQAGYTSEGVAIADASGGLPAWPFGWPMGFEGFRVTGDDGAVYSYVRSMSNRAHTWFPGYAALGLPARVFGPLELVGFRRVGVASAVEMTGTSGVIKAGVDDGAATWFYIETSAITQNEGNSGNTAYAITVRRGGDLSGTDTVTATVSGTGSNPANAADFGGSFPSQVLSFAPTEATKVFTVNVSGDTAGEQNETFAVTLSSPSTDTVLVGSGRSTITCTITNDDAALVGAFIWLVNDNEASALALSGSPSGATFLRASDTGFVTRSGISMRSRGVGTATNTSSFASLPYHSFDNAFHSADFQLAPGDWEVALLVFTNSGANGTVTMVDNPDATGGGSATTRQSIVYPSSSDRLNETNPAINYSTALTAVADAINAPLSYLPVTITDAGGGMGLLRVGRSAGTFNAVCAIAIREV